MRTSGNLLSGGAAFVKRIVETYVRGLDAHRLDVARDLRGFGKDAQRRGYR